MKIVRFRMRTANQNQLQGQLQPEPCPGRFYESAGVLFDNGSEGCNQQRLPRPLLSDVQVDHGLAPAEGLRRGDARTGAAEASFAVGVERALVVHRDDLCLFGLFSNFWQTLRGSFSAVSKRFCKYILGRIARLKALDEIYKISTLLHLLNPI